VKKNVTAKSRYFQKIFTLIINYLPDLNDIIFNRSMKCGQPVDETNGFYSSLSFPG
jgi:hypothetical protein